MGKRELTAERLRELVNYTPETGAFTRRVKVRQYEAGTTCGFESDDGYLLLRINNRTYLCHRLAWLYMTGEWPKFEIDHIDGVRNNNRWTNLRDVPKIINQQNQRNRPTTKTGLLGAYPNGRNRWAATIRHQGVLIRLGQFDSPEEAHQAYLCAKRRLHPGCTI